MYAVTKTYKDFNGVERTETKLFNLTETEVMDKVHTDPEFL